MIILGILLSIDWNPSNRWSIQLIINLNDEILFTRKTEIACCTTPAFKWTKLSKRKKERKKERKEERAGRRPTLSIVDVQPPLCPANPWLNRCPKTYTHTHIYLESIKWILKQISYEINKLVSDSTCNFSHQRLQSAPRSCWMLLDVVLNQATTSKRHHHGHTLQLFYTSDTIVPGRCCPMLLDVPTGQGQSKRTWWHNATSLISIQMD